ncbi:MAG: FlgD immunoglobulin-like domain containing protein, partial [candidate division WOR-3 bacterium]
RVTCLLRTDLTEPLRLDSCLVYPNPTRGPASFTFQLSRAALVSVKIWTIAGRLVRMLEPRPCQFGYNQIDWDGLDRFGMSLPNGVYLYRIDARTQEGTGQSYSASHRDRFIIHH